MADDLTEAAYAPADILTVLVEPDLAETACALAHIFAVDIVQNGSEAVQAPADILAVNIVGYLAKTAHAPADVFVRQHVIRSFIVLGDGGVCSSRRWIKTTAGLFIGLHGVIVSAALEAGGIGRGIGASQLTVFAHAAFTVVIFRHDRLPPKHILIRQRIRFCNEKARLEAVSKRLLDPIAKCLFVDTFVLFPDFGEHRDPVCK